MTYRILCCSKSPQQKSTRAINGNYFTTPSHNCLQCFGTDGRASGRP